MTCEIKGPDMAGRIRHPLIWSIDMKYFSADQLKEIGVLILDAAGSPHAESEPLRNTRAR